MLPSVLILPLNHRAFATPQTVLALRRNRSDISSTWPGVYQLLFPYTVNPLAAKKVVALSLSYVFAMAAAAVPHHMKWETWVLSLSPLEDGVDSYCLSSKRNLLPSYHRLPPEKRAFLLSPTVNSPLRMRVVKTALSLIWTS